MDSRRLVFLLLVVAANLFLGSMPVAAQESPAAPAAGYRLGPGDRIRVEVFREDDLTREVEIGGTGAISLPLIGELAVAGLTVSEVEEQVAARLRGRFLKDPRVNVAVVQYRKFYINGEVYRPGGYSYQPGLTVRKAISFAGGLKERASEKKIIIIREGQEGRPPTPARLDDAVHPGDTITVGQGFF